MNNIKKIAIIGVLLFPMMAQAKSDDPSTIKTANQFCSANEECKDIVSLELDGMYYKGINEPNSVSIGTLINRKAKEYKDFCAYSENKTMCENYKNQLMLKYITGLLNR